jgi:hypothetical protein
VVCWGHVRSNNLGPNGAGMRPFNQRETMNKSIIHSVLCILFVLFFLSACAGVPIRQSPIALATPKPTIQFKPCIVGSSQAQCGILYAYENRTAQTGRMIPLNIAVIRANNAQKAAEAIFWLADWRTR